MAQGCMEVAVQEDGFVKGVHVVVDHVFVADAFGLKKGVDKERKRLYFMGKRPGYFIKVLIIINSSNCYFSK